MKRKIIFAIVYFIFMVAAFIGLDYMGINNFTNPLLCTAISVVLGLFGGAVLLRID